MTLQHNGPARGSGGTYVPKAFVAPAPAAQPAPGFFGSLREQFRASNVERDARARVRTIAARSAVEKAEGAAAAGRIDNQTRIVQADTGRARALVERTDAAAEQEAATERYLYAGVGRVTAEAFRDAAPVFAAIAVDAALTRELAGLEEIHYERDFQTLLRQLPPHRAEALADSRERIEGARRAIREHLAAPPAGSPVPPAAGPAPLGSYPAAADLRAEARRAHQEAAGMDRPDAQGFLDSFLDEARAQFGPDGAAEVIDEWDRMGRLGG